MSGVSMSLSDPTSVREPNDAKSSVPKRKKRTKGTFPCEHCDKVYLRSDHLARHQLNHEPKVVYQCDFLVEEYGGVMRKCGKTFVRRDLKERHIKRHLEMREQELLMQNQQGLESPANAGMVPTNSGPLEAKDTDNNNKLKRRKMSAPMNQNPIQTQPQIPAPMPTQTLDVPPVYPVGNSPLQISKLIHANGISPGENPSQQFLPQPYPHPMSEPPNQTQTQVQGQYQPSPTLQQQQQGVSGDTGPSPVPPPPQMQFPQTNTVSAMQNPGYGVSPVLLTAFTPLPYNSQYPMGPSNMVQAQAQMQLQNQQSQLQNPQNQLQQMPLQQLLGGDPEGKRIVSAAEFYGPQGLNDPTDYKLNAGMPTSQNDILSWLFMDSSPNAMMVPQNGANNNNDSNNNNENLPVQQQQPQIIPDNAARNIPPPGQAHAYSANGVGQPPDELSSFYNVQTAFNNYGLSDVNIFHNDGNPLDDVFTRKHADHRYTGSNTPLSNSTLNHSANSTSTSPANSVDSNVSPMNAVDTENSEYLPIQKPPSSLPDIRTADHQLSHHAKHKNVKLNKHLFVDSLLVDSFTKLMPELNRDALEEIMPSSFEVTIEDRFSFYLYYYWAVFHPQFSVLHKPSFDTKLVQPHLVLAMIVVGCQYAPHDDNFQENVPYRERRKLALFRLSEMIITPLRFLIFQHSEFKSPVKLWILQSLNMIEWCEKNFLSRHLHERAHLHHGTTVQLLRRSPLLGGNPSKKSKRTSRSINSSADEESDLVATDSNDTAAAALSGGKVVDEAEDYDLFVKWVDLELMKRITFMTFYMDIMDYVKYRHNPQIMFYQLQLLSLPCDDEFLWESRDANGSFKKIVKQQRKLLHKHQQLQNPKFQSVPEGKELQPDTRTPTAPKTKSENAATVAARAIANNGPNHAKAAQRAAREERLLFSDSFLNALKTLLKLQGNESQVQPSTSLFRKKILFAGLTSIMFQMQQTDIQKNTVALTTGGLGMLGYKEYLWKEIIAKVLDNWNVDVNGDCTHVIVPRKSLLERTNALTQCKFPMYHLVQIIGISDINQYDIAIYGGSPGNMSVDATSKDYYIVERKLKMMWSKNVAPERRSISSLINLKCVVHCYLFLWELMLQPTSLESLEGSKPQVAQNPFLDWDINLNYFDRLYTISTAMLVLWCYTFLTHGQESTRFDEAFNLDTPYETLVQSSAENGYEYLLRIRMEFSTHLRRSNLHHDYNIHPFRLNNNSHTMHEVLTQYCNLLPQITNKQNILGLCFLIGKKLLNSQCEILRENAKLILNCGMRSIGKKSIYCMDLFDNEFSE